ncbi:MAG: lipoprotein LpqH [Mycobacterium sp.]
MKREFLVAAAGATIIVGGCATSNAAPSGPVVLIDGQDQGVEDMKVYCHSLPAIGPTGSVGELFNVAIGNTGGIQVTTTGTPMLEHFGFAKQPYNLEYQWGQRPDVDAKTVLIQTGKSYKVSGTATGYELQTAVTKSFEAEVSCP